MAASKRSIALACLATLVIFIVAYPKCTIAATNVTTATHVNVYPNPPRVGNTIRVDAWVQPVPPSSNGQVIVTLTKPDGDVEQVGSLALLSNGSASFDYVPLEVGNYTVQVNFTGATASNGSGDYYEPSLSQRINVQVLTNAVPEFPVFVFPLLFVVLTAMAAFVAKIHTAKTKSPTKRP